MSKNKGKKKGNVQEISNQNGTVAPDEVEIDMIGDEKMDSEEITQVSPQKADQPDPQEQLEALKNEQLYLQAEFENYKRKAIKERSDLIKYGSERLVRDLLNVVDIFEMALNTEVTAENFQNFLQGVQMTSKELHACLERNGVKKIDSLGQPFDPLVHEALSSEETGEIEAGHVYRVFKQAFKMHDRVVRPAQVVVAKPLSKNNEDSSSSNASNGSN